MNNKCACCGFRKKKFYLCHHCNVPVCHKCITAGLCKDCFTQLETSDYTKDYVYPLKSDIPEGLL